MGGSSYEYSPYLQDGEARDTTAVQSGSSDLSDAGHPSASSQEALSVSAALSLAKQALESVTIKLVGEVSEVSNKPGYKAVYFTVKDEHSSLPCMMWLNRYRSAGIELRVGMLVELTGRFTLYAAKGRMNFDVFSCSLAGEGTLRLQVANLARKLEAEGLMRPERKRALPALPLCVGLVTSPRGAAVHDVLRTLRRRWPLAQVLFAGVPVEGVNAAAGLISALDAVQDAGAEVVLLVRGGGSFEDLMPFNDEQLVRAIARAKVPVVTGIGHEPDTSIADMVADLRASTPTAAAEAVSPDIASLDAALLSLGATLVQTMDRRIEKSSIALDRLGQRSVLSDPQTLLASAAQGVDMAAERFSRVLPLALERSCLRLDGFSDRLQMAGSSILPRFEQSCALIAARLHDLSPLATLARGYAIARDDKDAIVKSVRGVSTGDHVAINLHDGVLSCTVDAIQEVEIEAISLGGDDDR